MYNGRGIECHEPHVHRDFIVENNRLSVKPCNIFYEGIDKSTPQQIIEQHSKGIWPSAIPNPNININQDCLKTRIWLIGRKKLIQ